MARIITLSVILLSICLLAGWNAWRLISKESHTNSTLGGAFTLTDTQGRTFSSTSLHDQYLLVYFGFSFCPDICPTELQRMTQLMDNLPPAIAKQITPIFISVDPERDTPAALADYIQHFHSRFIALTGTKEQLTDISKRYGAYYQINKKSATDKDYPVDHSSFIYLMDKQGYYIGHFTHDTPLSAMQAKITSSIGASHD